MHYTDPVHHIKVFYDADCGMCAKARKQLSAEPMHLDVEFIPLQSDCARELLGTHYNPTEMRKELHLLADNGDLWLGAEAWIVLLWATCRWRTLAGTLSSPIFKPVVKQVVRLISENRFRISDLMKLQADATPEETPCSTEACSI